LGVAERKPPLEVVPASCAYPSSLFLPLPSLDHLSVPVLFAVLSRVSLLQLSRPVLRPHAPRVHSELRYPSTGRGPYFCLSASLHSVPPSLGRSSQRPPRPCLLLCWGHAYGCSRELRTGPGPHHSLTSPFRPLYGPEVLGLHLGAPSVQRRRPPAARFRPPADPPSPSPLEPPRPPLDGTRQRLPPTPTNVLGLLCGCSTAPPASVSPRVHSLMRPCHPATPFPGQADVPSAPRTPPLSPTAYRTLRHGPPYQLGAALVVSSYSLTPSAAPPLVLLAPSS
jgi:hypothetical protein